MSERQQFDVVVVGGGPAGATAAETLARAGRGVLLLDRAGRIKPCGGAIPPRLIRDFAIPDTLLVAKVNAARMVAPSGMAVDMPIENGFVGMVDRADFDPWLRARAAEAGADRAQGRFTGLDRSGAGYTLRYMAEDGREVRVTARAVIGADGARSDVAHAVFPKAREAPCVFAYHEIVRSPGAETGFDGRRCDVWYQGRVSPDFYGWVFPHGATTSVGVGSAHKGFSLRGATGLLREAAGLGACDTLRREGAPIPLQPRRRFDDGQGVVLAGDAAGVVAPASGEGIYYAMVSGQFAAEAVEAFLATGRARALAQARRRFMKLHGQVFFVLGLLQWVWYANDRRREGFVKLCRDPDVQRLTWQAYMNKELVRDRPVGHMRVLAKDLAQLVGLGAR